MTRDAESGFDDVARELMGQGVPSLAMYKDKCLRRRLAVRMRACGVHTYPEYAEVLRKSPGEAARLLSTLTINVTQFFRNEEAWDALGAVLRTLLPGRGRSFRGWSAGCATGEEPYSLAMLLAEIAAERGSQVSLTGADIEATDVDPDCLRRAATGRYAMEAFGTPLPPRARAWMQPVEGEEGVVEIHPAIRRLVRFRRHDLGRDPAPGRDYDVVICRNVVIYFEREIQETLFQTFVDALAPGGLLLLGKVETLFGPARDQMEPVDVRARLFRRSAA